MFADVFADFANTHRDQLRKGHHDLGVETFKSLPDFKQQHHQRILMPVIDVKAHSRFDEFGGLAPGVFKDVFAQGPKSLGEVVQIRIGIVELGDQFK